MSARARHVFSMTDRPPRLKRSRARREQRRRADRRDTVFIYALIAVSGLAVVGLVWLGSLSFA